MVTDDEQMLTTREVADLIRKSPKTVSTMAATKVIPATKVGGEWRFFRSEVLEALRPKAVDIWEQPKRALAKRGRAA
jgi:excisionase family DNA binding protein